MRILVTGAAGFIGYHVSKRLLEDGHEVDGLDNLNDYYDVRLKEDRLAGLAEVPAHPHGLGPGAALGRGRGLQPLEMARVGDLLSGRRGAEEEGNQEGGEQQEAGGSLHAS